MKSNPYGLKIFQGVDLISTKIDPKNPAENKKGAYFSRFTVGVDKFGVKYVLNIHRERGMSFRAQVARIKEGARKFSPELIVVEDNQSQTWIVQELRNTTDIPIMSFTTTAKKRDLEEGVPSLALEFENGKIVLPYGDNKTREIMDVFVDELTGYPFANTSDVLMSFYLCMQGVRKRAKTHIVTKDLAEAMQEQIDSEDQKSLYERVKNNTIFRA